MVMHRRELILAAALAIGRAAWAQQTATPVIGFLSSRGAPDSPELLAAFRQGLADTGFVDGQNIAIEYRFAENDNTRLPGLVSELVRRPVAVIVAVTTPAALAAHAATATIPIVFEGGTDPVQLGLVSSLARPGGNVTGVTHLSNEIAPKRLQLLRELVPAAAMIALLANPNDRDLAAGEVETDSVLSAARALGVQLRVLKAGSESDFDPVFASLTGIRAGALLINSDPFFTARQEQLAALAMRYRVPAAYSNREFVLAGGLMSYGGGNVDAYHLCGVYAARILKGEKPAELAVQQATKVELYLNLRTAGALGLSVPSVLRTRADEVVE
jgi:putative tryptophan/tyrosine transport system substrate-binding protein